MKRSSKPSAKKTKVVRGILKISGTIIVGLIFYSIVNALLFDGIKLFYCLSNDKCVTVWKRKDGQVYLIPGKYQSTVLPNNNFVKIKNTAYLDVIFISNKRMLINTEYNIKIVQSNSSSISMEQYNSNKAMNDSLYTYLDKKYRKYKENVEYIGIDVEDNYATDRTGKKMK